MSETKPFLLHIWKNPKDSAYKDELSGFDTVDFDAYNDTQKEKELWGGGISIPLEFTQDNNYYIASFGDIYTIKIPKSLVNDDDIITVHLTKKYYLLFIKITNTTTNVVNQYIFYNGNYNAEISTHLLLYMIDHNKLDLTNNRLMELENKNENLQKSLTSTKQDLNQQILELDKKLSELIKLTYDYLIGEIQKVNDELIKLLHEIYCYGYS